MIGIGKRRSERRKSRRLDFRAKALIKHDDITFSGEIRNISSTGVYLATNGMHTVNELIELTIFFDHGTSKLAVTAPCKVGRIDGQGVGLVSLHIDTNKLLHLELIFDIHKNNAQQLVEEFCKSI